MHITFSPQRSDATLTVSKQGDALTINGSVYDFTSLPEGGTIPAKDIPCEFIVDDVHRIGGDLHMTLVLPHGPSPFEAVAFPQPLVVTEDGPIALPGGEDVDA